MSRFIDPEKDMSDAYSILGFIFFVIGGLLSFWVVWRIITAETIDDAADILSLSLPFLFGILGCICFGLVFIFFPFDGK